MTPSSTFLAYVRVPYYKGFSELPANVATPAAGLLSSTPM